MNGSNSITAINTNAGADSSVSAAKARLLAWATECDANAMKSRASLGSVALNGALTVVGGMAIVRLFLPRGRSSRTTVERRLISWALLARAGVWLLPRAIEAMQNVLKARVVRPCTSETLQPQTVG